MKREFERDMPSDIKDSLSRRHRRVEETYVDGMQSVWRDEYCENPRPERGPLKLYHICTKGTVRTTLFREDVDYHKALNIAAISAFALEVDILAYCLMSNHVHFIVAVINDENAGKFINRFKQLYSHYFNIMYPAGSVRSDIAEDRTYVAAGSMNAGGRAFKRVDATIKRIDSIPYLKNCLAYVMRNPVEAGAAKTPDAYKWSSYRCYFSGQGAFQNTSPVTAFQKRGLMDLLGTHTDVSASHFRITEAGNILPESFVDRALVEQIFDGSRDALSRQIMKVNYYTLEYELAYSDKLRLTDDAVLRIAGTLSMDWYGKSLQNLDVKEKIRLIGTLKKKSNANALQICRILELDQQLASELFDI